MLVKIGRFPGKVEEIDIEENSTVKQAVEVAELSVDSTTAIQVNGEPSNLSATLYANDMVRLTKQIKGN